jgi:salicylate hydroxylase
MRARKILVAGGGIGGLTAAASLLQAGFDVEVYEQAPALGEVGAGIQLSANPMRVLRHLGVMERVRARGFSAVSYDFKLYDTEEVLQRIPLGPGYEERQGVPYVSIHRADLLDVLIDRVRELKSDAVTLDAKAVGYEEDADGVALRLADGREVRGDALVAADGIRSAIRAQMLGPARVTYTGDQSWRVIVPSARLSGTARHDTIDIYVGPGKHGVVYPIRRGELVNLVGCVEYEDVAGESWTTRRPWDELKSDFEGWNGYVQAVIDATDRDECYRWAMNNRPPVEAWSTARTTLLGDAAHPTLPYMAQGGAMAIEDGLVLARALAQEPDVTEALQLYQRNRIPRTTRIVNESSANRAMFHLPSAEALREAFARRNMAGERNAWLFSYDAATVPLA